MPHSGMRPEQIYTLSWQHVDVSTERVIHIPGGKTKNAKRTLALTQKVYDMLMTRYQREGAPREGGSFQRLRSQDTSTSPVSSINTRPRSGRQASRTSNCIAFATHS